jgi:hypothetical protein
MATSAQMPELNLLAVSGGGGNGACGAGLLCGWTDYGGRATFELVTGALMAPFDPGYMRALYDYGYERGRNGYDSVHKPPLT